MKKGFPLSIISILILSCFVLLALGSINDNKKIADLVANAPYAKDNIDETEIVVLNIGDTVTYEDWDYKVVEVETHTTIKKETARGIYVVAIIEATNNSKSPRDLGNFFRVIDKEGRTFNFDSSASLAHHQTFRVDTWHYSEIGPSLSGLLPYAFDVPEDAESLRLIPKDIKEEELSEVSPILLTESVK